MPFPLHVETIMHLGKALAVAAVTLSAAASHAWTLVYANDASGNTTAGSLQSLRTAVNNGASVKVVVTAPGTHNWSVLCNQVAVKFDASQGVICVSGMQLLIDNSMGANFAAVANPPQSADFTINTQGQYSQSNVRISDGVLVSKTLVYHPMQWFVD